jgi:hypothetical protein
MVNWRALSVLLRAHFSAEKVRIAAGFTRTRNGAVLLIEIVVAVARRQSSARLLIEDLGFT